MTQGGPIELVAPAGVAAPLVGQTLGAVVGVASKCSRLIVPDDMHDLLRLTVGDDSGSHHERWRLDVGKYRFNAPDYGKVGVGTFAFKRGEVYPVDLTFVARNMPEEHYDETSIIALGGTYNNDDVLNGNDWVRFNEPHTNTDDVPFVIIDPVQTGEGAHPILNGGYSGPESKDMSALLYFSVTDIMEIQRVEPLDEERPTGTQRIYAVDVDGSPEGVHISLDPNFVANVGPLRLRATEGSEVIFDTVVSGEITPVHLDGGANTRHYILAAGVDKNANGSLDNDEVMLTNYADVAKGNTDASDTVLKEILAKRAQIDDAITRLGELSAANWEQPWESRRRGILAALIVKRQHMDQQLSDAGLSIDALLSDMKAVAGGIEKALGVFNAPYGHIEDAKSAAQVFLQGLGPEVDPSDIPEYVHNLADGVGNLQEAMGQLNTAIGEMQTALQIYSEFKNQQSAGSALRLMSAGISLVNNLMPAPGISDMLDYYAEMLTAIGNLLDKVQEQVGQHNLILLEIGLTPLYEGAWYGHEWARSVLHDAGYHDLANAIQ